MNLNSVMNDIINSTIDTKYLDEALKATNSITATYATMGNLLMKEPQEVNSLVYSLGSEANMLTQQMNANVNSILKFANFKASLDFKINAMLREEEQNKLLKVLRLGQIANQNIQLLNNKIKLASNLNNFALQTGNPNIAVGLDFTNGNITFTKPNPNSKIILDINTNNAKSILNLKLIKNAVDAINNNEPYEAIKNLAILKGNPTEVYKSNQFKFLEDNAKIDLLVQKEGSDKVLKMLTDQYKENGLTDEEAKKQAINTIKIAQQYSPLRQLVSKTPSIYEPKVARTVTEKIINTFNNGNKQQALQNANQIFSKYNYDYDVLSKSPYKTLLTLFKNPQETLTMYKFTNIIKNSKLEPKAKQTLLSVNNAIMSGNINNKEQLIKGLNILEQVGSKTLNTKDYGRLINAYITKLQEYNQNGKLDNNTFNILRKSLNELKAVKYANEAIKTNNMKNFKKYLSSINSDNGINMVLNNTTNIEQFVDTSENIYKSNIEPITGKPIDYIGEKNKEILKATYNKISTKIADIVDWLSKTFGIQKTTLDGQTLREKLSSTDNKLIGSLYLKSTVEELSSNTPLSKVMKQYGITYKDLLQYIPKETDNFEDFLFRKDNEFAEQLNQLKDKLNLEPRTLLTVASNYAIFKKQNKYKDFASFLKNENKDLYNKIIIDYSNNFGSEFLESRNDMINKNKSKWINDIDRGINELNVDLDTIKDYLLRIGSASATLMTLQKIQSLNY